MVDAVIRLGSLEVTDARGAWSLQMNMPTDGRVLAIRISAAHHT
jgi:hypothetical protein